MQWNLTAKSTVNVCPVVCCPLGVAEACGLRAVMWRFIIGRWEYKRLFGYASLTCGITQRHLKGGMAFDALDSIPDSRRLHRTAGVCTSAVVSVLSADLVVTSR